MKLFRTGSCRAVFKVIATTRSSQAALMVLKPGTDTGKPANEHAHSEQWLFVVSGTGKALVNKRRVTLRKGSLLLIQKGEIHQIRAADNQPLVTLNFYAPPAYAKDGEPRTGDR